MSIRNSLQGMLADFVRAAGFQYSHAVDAACELVFLLAAYREEDSPLFPELYLIDGTVEGDVLSAIAPGAERIEIGSTSHDRRAASDALKKCAALATEDWSIYLLSGATQFTFGIFRAYQLPYSVSASESLQAADPSIGAVILFRNCAANCVELRDGSGHNLEVSLTSAPPSGSPVSTLFGDLAAEVSANVDAEIKDTTRGYLTRLLSDICRGSHGALIGVVPSSQARLPAMLSDGVILRERISFVQPLKEAILRRNDSALALLRSREALLRGMIRGDGITVLGSDATIRAFRVFIKPTANESKLLKENSVPGGARSRAFELMKLRLGKTFGAVFFRSQDGRTAFERAKQ